MMALAVVMGLSLSSPIASASNDEEMDVVVRQIEKNVCANAGPFRYADVKKKLEASACVDCAAKAANKSPAGGSLEQLLKVTDGIKGKPAPASTKAIRERDLAFYKFLETAGQEESLSDLNERLKHQREALKEEQSSLKDNQKDVAKYTGLVKAVRDIPKKIPPKSVLTELLSNATNKIDHETISTGQLNRRIEDLNRFLKLAAEQPKKYPSHYVAERRKMLERAKERLEKSQATLTNMQALKSWLENPKSAPPVTDAIRESVLKDYKTQLDDAQDSLKAANKSIESSKRAIQKILEKIARLKNPKKAKPKVDPSELASFEARANESLEDIADNNGYRTCGMTAAELLALRLYTGSAYGPLNRALRGDDKTRAQVKPFADVLMAALAKLRAYQGPVSRGANIPPERLALHEVGKIVDNPGFTSSAILSAGFGDKVKFVIASKTGRYIGSFSNSYGEREVLFPPGRRFKVLKKEEVDGHIEITMEEVD